MLDFEILDIIVFAIVFILNSSTFDVATSSKTTWARLENKQQGCQRTRLMTNLTDKDSWAHVKPKIFIVATRLPEGLAVIGFEVVFEFVFFFSMPRTSTE